MARVENSRLLIVEDEEDLRSLYRDILLNVADEVDLAKNGEEGLEMAQTRKFDAIVSDINMPIMSGVQMLMNLRQMKVYTPVVFLSAYGQLADFETAKKSDAFCLLEKPVKNDIFRDKIEAALRYGQKFSNFEKELQVKVAALGEQDPEKISEFRDHERDEFLRRVVQTAV